MAQNNASTILHRMVFRSLGAGEQRRESDEINKIDNISLKILMVEKGARYHFYFQNGNSIAATENEASDPMSHEHGCVFT